MGGAGDRLILGNDEEALKLLSEAAPDTIRVKNLDTAGGQGDTHRMATVVLTIEAAEQARRLPTPIRARLENLLARLKKWPAVSGAKALSGNLAGWYRLRTGDYRVRFHVKGETVVVDKIGHRGEFYED